MTVKELRQKLSHYNDDDEVIFYNLSNNNLVEYNLESIVNADNRVEITTTSEDLE